MPQAPGPLAGVRIIDLTEFIFGPYATQTLGDLGAEVVKVENPEGDRQRYRTANRQKRGDGRSTFMTLNRNKRSVTLDLKTEEGRAQAARARFRPPRSSSTMCAPTRWRGSASAMTSVAKTQPVHRLCPLRGLRLRRPLCAAPGASTTSSRRRRARPICCRKFTAIPTCACCRPTSPTRSPDLHAIYARSPRFTTASAPAKASSSKCRCSNASPAS